MPFSSFLPPSFCICDCSQANAGRNAPKGCTSCSSSSRTPRPHSVSRRQNFLRRSARSRSALLRCLTLLHRLHDSTRRARLSSATTLHKPPNARSGSMPSPTPPSFVPPSSSSKHSLQQLPLQHLDHIPPRTHMRTRTQWGQFSFCNCAKGRFFGAERPRRRGTARRAPSLCGVYAAEKKEEEEARGNKNGSEARGIASADRTDDVQPVQLLLQIHPFCVEGHA